MSCKKDARLIWVKIAGFLFEPSSVSMLFSESSEDSGLISQLLRLVAYLHG